MQSPHEIQTPSPWVERWAPLIASGAVVLDLACGYGRHARFLAARDCSVVAVDRDEQALAALADVRGIRPVMADLEGAPWPFGTDGFDAIIVTNYLHRPLFPHLTAALRPDGVLLYETFMVGNERFGKPSNPNFLLRANELFEALATELRVVAFEQGCASWPRPAVVQRVCAIRGRGENVTI